jgi:hypothetical protein
VVLVGAIALYAVFRKENRTRDPLQRSQGGKQGEGLGMNPEDDPSAVGAALNAYLLTHSISWKKVIVFRGRARRP